VTAPGHAAIPPLRRSLFRRALNGLFSSPYSFNRRCPPRRGLRRSQDEDVPRDFLQNAPAADSLDPMIRIGENVVPLSCLSSHRSTWRDTAIGGRRAVPAIVGAKTMTAGGRPMDYFYLDIGPMIRLLRQNPGEFELRHDRVHHRPSRLQLALRRNDDGRIVARCNSVEFPINHEQGVALRAAIENWEECYWRPQTARKAPGRHVTRHLTLINRRFGSYFALNAKWHRTIAAVVAWFGNSARARNRWDTKPHLRLVSSLPDDVLLRTGLPRRPQPGRTDSSSAR